MADTEHGRARRVLVVDDDPEARWLVAEALVEHGFNVSEATDGEQARQSISAQSPDLVVLDLGLPGINGLELLGILRAEGSLPVIVLTGRGSQSDRIVGLELGADDYVVKPFDPRELVARVKAILRRTHTAVAADRLDFGDIVIDLTSRDVHRGPELIDLTAREFDLLAFMASSPRQVFSREQLLANVWNSSIDWQDPATVNEHVHRLRRKIEADPSSPRWIRTRRGAGYRFDP